MSTTINVKNFRELFKIAQIGDEVTYGPVLFYKKEITGTGKDCYGEKTIFLEIGTINKDIFKTIKPVSIIKQD